MATLKEEDYKNLTILHRAMIAGSIMFFCIIIYLIQSGGRFNHNVDSIFFIIPAIAIPISILFGSKVYSTNINNATTRTFESYEDAVMNFRATNIIKWALVEGMTLVSIVFGFIDANPYIFAATLIGIFFLITSSVKREHFRNYKHK